MFYLITYNNAITNYPYLVRDYRKYIKENLKNSIYFV